MFVAQINTFLQALVQPVPLQPHTQLNSPRESFADATQQPRRSLNAELRGVPYKCVFYGEQGRRGGGRGGEGGVCSSVVVTVRARTTTKIGFARTLPSESVGMARYVAESGREITTKRCMCFHRRNAVQSRSDDDNIIVIVANSRDYRITSSLHDDLGCDACRNVVLGVVRMGWETETIDGSPPQCSAFPHSSKMVPDDSKSPCHKNATGMADRSTPYQDSTQLFRFFRPPITTVVILS